MRATSRSVSVALMLGVELIALTIPTLAAACAVCMGSSPADRGYFWGILFLMSMPFTVAGLVGSWLVYEYRRGQRGVLTTSSVQTPARNFLRQLLVRSGVASRDDERQTTPEQTFGRPSGVWTPR